mmetsp:Transcript_50431/g.119952  ORF Transcript_50431/g.119952 Transcript_50431/m.119952 type:complete len:223 (-) Transcript_50431:51-719(-)
MPQRPEAGKPFHLEGGDHQARRLWTSAANHSNLGLSRAALSGQLRSLRHVEDGSGAVGGSAGQPLPATGGRRRHRALCCPGADVRRSDRPQGRHVFGRDHHGRALLSLRLWDGASGGADEGERGGPARRLHRRASSPGCPRLSMPPGGGIAAAVRVRSDRAPRPAHRDRLPPPAPPARRSDDPGAEAAPGRQSSPSQSPGSDDRVTALGPGRSRRVPCCPLC